MNVTTATVTIDPTVTALASAKSAVATLESRASLYASAAGKVEAKLQKIRAEELDPINGELGRIRQELETARRGADVQAFVTLGGTEDTRKHNLQFARTNALFAYRAAQINKSAPREQVEAEWAAVIHGYEAEQTTVGRIRIDGTEVRQSEVDAVQYARFMAIRTRMGEYAAS